MARHYDCGVGRIGGSVGVVNQRKARTVPTTAYRLRQVITQQALAEPQAIRSRLFSVLACRGVVAGFTFCVWTGPASVIRLYASHEQGRVGVPCPRNSSPCRFRFPQLDRRVVTTIVTPNPAALRHSQQRVDGLGKESRANGPRNQDGSLHKTQ